MCLDPGPHVAGVEWSLQAKSPRKRSAAYSLVETLKVGVHMRSPARPPGVVVGYDAAGRPVDVRDNTQKVRLRRSPPAAHTRADRLRATHLGKSLPRVAAEAPTTGIVWLPLAVDPDDEPAARGDQADPAEEKPADDK